MNLLQKRMRPLGITLAMLGIWGISILVQRDVDRQMAPMRDTPETLWITSGKALRILSAGNQALLADVYWTRAVQYYGSRLRDHKTDFSLLDPLLNITVTLDPRLMIAYYFGSMFLSERPPRGAGEADKAVALLKRGIEANPHQWRLWHHLGFIYYWELRDYEKAAAAYQEGAKDPNARDWMKVMAAAILEKGGSRDTSLFLWEKIYDSSEDPTIRDNALGHIQAIRARNDMDALEELAKRFQSRTGRWPASVAEMVAEGFLKAQPIDPAGYPYRLLPDGTAALSPESKVRPDYDNAPEPPPRALPDGPQ
jgi:tetratricopeptide (TPR) repeat protein